MPSKCPKCKGPMVQQYDRQYCSQCGNSVWFFNMRDMNPKKKGGK